MIWEMKELATLNPLKLPVEKWVDIKKTETQMFEMLLDEGWEPYAVTESSTYTIHYFKRERQSD